MKLLRNAAALGLLLCLLVLIAPVFAGNVSWSGRLENPDPFMDHIDENCTTLYGSVEWYDVQPFYVTTSGSYTIAMTSITGALSPDGWFTLYDTTFDPTNAAARCLVADDDGGSGWAPQITASLVANHQYVLVTTQCCDGLNAGEEMNYTNTISGPGDIILSSLAGDCPYPLPAGLTQGQITETTSAFWAADTSATTDVVIPVGSHWWILNTTDDFVQLWITCQGSPVWVPASVIVPD